MKSPLLMKSRRSQGGYTLMELLIAISISSLILVPLLAWSIVAVRQQPVLRDDIVRTASTGLLGSYFPRDVAVSGAASTSGEDCIGGDGAGGSVRLVLITGGRSDTKIVYSEATRSNSDPDGQGDLSLWRRECDASTGELRSAVEAYEGIVTNSTQVTCTSDPDDSPCRQVDLSTIPASSKSGERVSLRASRRVDYVTDPADAEVKVPPTAVITVVDRTGTQPLTVDFTASHSTDLDGSIVNYRWEFSEQPVSDSPVAVREGPDQADQRWVFPTAGEYTVWLTVTDDDGLTNTTHLRITTDNHEPIAVIDLARKSGVAGLDEFTFDASRSYDVDGSIGSYRWVIDFEGDDQNPDGSSIQLAGRTVGQVFPPDVRGIAVVTLTVTDLQGGTGSASEMITVHPPGGNPSDPPTEDDPIPVISAVPGTAARQINFDASGSTAASPIASYTWQLAPAVSQVGVTTSYTFPAPGVYVVSLTVVDDQGRSAVRSKEVTVEGPPPKPSDPWREGNDLVWRAVPGVRRYVINFEFYTKTDCFKELPEQVLGALPAPRKAIPANPCPKGAETRARVGADTNGQITYSNWVIVTVPTKPPTTTTAPEVVK